MVEADVNLGDCIEVEFISHNRDYCRPYRSGCPDKTAPPYRTGSRVLSFLIGNNIHCIDHALKQTSKYLPSRQLSDAVDTGIDGILRKFAKPELFGGPIKARGSRIAIVRGALALFGADQANAAKQILALLNSQDVFEAALEEVVNDHFEISGWTLPE